MSSLKKKITKHTKESKINAHSLEKEILTEKENIPEEAKTLELLLVQDVKSTVLNLIH